MKAPTFPPPANAEPRGGKVVEQDLQLVRVYMAVPARTQGAEEDMLLGGKWVARGSGGSTRAAAGALEGGAKKELVFLGLGTAPRGGEDRGVGVGVVARRLVSALEEVRRA